MLEAQAGPLEDLRIEVAAVVDDDRDRRAAAQRTADVGEHVDNPLRVRTERGLARPCGRGAHLELAPVVEAEELVGVPVLLVVVDQPRVGR